jgi:hypothetical protein
LPHGKRGSANHIATRSIVPRLALQSAAIHGTIEAAPVAHRKALAITLERFAFDERHVWAWATGGRGPAIVCHLLLEIQKAAEIDEAAEALAKQETAGSA